MRDIVYYLTLGFSNLQGTPSIMVHEGEIQSAEVQTLEFHPVEFYDISISERQLDEECQRRSELHLLALHAASHGKPSMDRSAANLASTQEQTSDFQFDRVRFPFEPWIGNYLNVKSNVECAISDFATLRRREVRATRPKRRTLTWWQGCFGR